MATTIQAVRDALQSDGPALFYDGEETLLYSFAHQGQLMAITINLLEDGEYIRFRIPHYLNLSRTPHHARVVEKLLDLNYSFKLLKFGMNLTDGEVSVEIDLPLDDSEPTLRQLNRCMFYLLEPAIKERGSLLSLMETGIYPGSEDVGFCASLERLLPDEDFVQQLNPANGTFLGDGQE